MQNNFSTGRMTTVTTTAKTLEQTKGKFKVVGRIKGIDNEKSYRQGVTKNGDDYQSINFLLETVSNNTVAVELFGMKTDNVLVMNFKEKDKKKQRKKDFLACFIVGSGAGGEVRGLGHPGARGDAGSGA